MRFQKTLFLVICRNLRQCKFADSYSKHQHIQTNILSFRMYMSMCVLAMVYWPVGPKRVGVYNHVMRMIWHLLMYRIHRVGFDKGAFPSVWGGHTCVSTACSVYIYGHRWYMVMGHPISIVCRIHRAGFDKVSCKVVAILAQGSALSCSRHLKLSIFLFKAFKSQHLRVQSISNSTFSC